MNIDVSAGIVKQLEATQQVARQHLMAGQLPLAAEAYRRCARLMKELIPQAVSSETQKARLEKARQFLDLAKRVEEGKVRLDGAAGPGGRAVQCVDETEEAASALQVRIQELIIRSAVRWEEIGGLEATKREIQAAYALAMARPPEGIRVRSNRSILLYGPPGTGKTLLAAAASSGLDATFFNVKASSLLSKFFGESARLVTTLYAEARRRAPSVVFIDELESLVASRSEGLDGPERRILGSLLTELDGLAGKGAPEFLLTIAATNTPWDLDEAVLSRFGKLIYVPLPDAVARRAVFGIQLDCAGYATAMDREELVARSAGYSGRDIEKLCTEAIERMLAAANPEVLDAAGQRDVRLRERQLTARPISCEEFEAAFARIRPKTDAVALRKFEQWAAAKADR